MFAELSPAQADPILSLSVLFQQDTRPNKVDLGIGVYRNDQGETPIMDAVANAMRHQACTQRSKSYVGLAGNADFNQHMQRLLLEGTSAYDRAITIQTPGASGALRLLADLLVQANPTATIWLSNPSYVNHKPIMEAAGLRVESYCYFDFETKTLDQSGFFGDIKRVKRGDVVLLHGCCHNPTGVDLSLFDWDVLTTMALEQGFIPFIDLAYHGFGQGLRQDLAGIHYLAERVPEWVMASSCSKNFGLYRERTGVAVVVGKSLADAEKAKGRLLQLARSTYTMPPDHGADLIQRIFSDETLTQDWISEVEEMRLRMLSMRKGLVREIQKLDCHKFDFINDHQGMFSMTGLSVEQIDRLRNEFAIYVIRDGRINLAGLQEHQLSLVANAFVAVL